MEVHDININKLYNNSEIGTSRSQVQIPIGINSLYHNSIICSNYNSYLILLFGIVKYK